MIYNKSIFDFFNEPSRHSLILFTSKGYIDDSLLALGSPVTFTESISTDENFNPGSFVARTMELSILKPDARFDKIDFEDMGISAWAGVRAVDFSVAGVLDEIKRRYSRVPSALAVCDNWSGNTYLPRICCAYKSLPYLEIYAADGFTYPASGTNHISSRITPEVQPNDGFLSLHILDGKLFASTASRMNAYVYDALTGAHQETILFEDEHAILAYNLGAQGVGISFNYPKGVTESSNAMRAYTVSAGVGATLEYVSLDTYFAIEPLSINANLIKLSCNNANKFLDAKSAQDFIVNYFDAYPAQWEIDGVAYKRTAGHILSRLTQPWENVEGQVIYLPPLVDWSVVCDVPLEQTNLAYEIAGAFGDSNMTYRTLISKVAEGSGLFVKHTPKGTITYGSHMQKISRDVRLLSADHIAHDADFTVKADYLYERIETKYALKKEVSVKLINGSRIQATANMTAVGGSGKREYAITDNPFVAIFENSSAIAIEAATKIALNIGRNIKYNLPPIKVRTLGNPCLEAGDLIKVPEASFETSRDMILHKRALSYAGMFMDTYEMTGSKLIAPAAYGSIGTPITGILGTTKAFFNVRAALYDGNTSQGVAMGQVVTVGSESKTVTKELMAFKVEPNTQYKISANAKPNYTTPAAINSTSGKSNTYTEVMLKYLTIPAVFFTAKEYLPQANGYPQSVNIGAIDPNIRYIRAWLMGAGGNGGIALNTGQQAPDSYTFGGGGGGGGNAVTTGMIPVNASTQLTITPGRDGRGTYSATNGESSTLYAGGQSFTAPGGSHGQNGGMNGGNYPVGFGKPVPYDVKGTGGNGQSGGGGGGGRGDGYQASSAIGTGGIGGVSGANGLAGDEFASPSTHGNAANPGYGGGATLGYSFGTTASNPSKKEGLLYGGGGSGGGGYGGTTAWGGYGAHSNGAGGEGGHGSTYYGSTVSRAGGDGKRQGAGGGGSGGGKDNKGYGKGGIVIIQYYK